MKKHPIDELFASNLREHSTLPSQRAAELFQKRLAENQQPKGVLLTLTSRKYYWAAAASILFILGAGGWFFVQQNGQSTPNVVQNTQKVIISSDDKNPPENIQSSKSIAEIGLSETFEQPAISKSSMAEVNKKSTKVAPNNKASALPEVDAVEQDIQPLFKRMVLDEPIMDKLTVAVLDAEREKKKEAAKTRKTQNTEETLFQNSVAETVIVISEIKPKEEQLFIPEISGDSRVSIAQATEMGREKQQADRSLIAKVFTEIKNLKHGEKLDVAGLNEKTNNVFVRSEGGFIANEREEISYRLNRLKEAFGKNESK